MHGVFNKHIVLPRNIKIQNQGSCRIHIGGKLTVIAERWGDFSVGGCEAGTFPVRFNVQWGVPRPDARIKSPKLFEVYVSGAFGEGLKLLKMPQGCEILRATLCEPDGMEITLVVVFPYAVLPYFEAYLFKSFGEIAVGAG